MKTAPTLQEDPAIITQTSDFAPVRIIEVELGQPLPTLTAFDEKKGRDYQRARCLVRLHTQPLGLVELNIDKDELGPDEYASEIWQALHLQINEHLRQDGLPPVTSLPAVGLPGCAMPPCVEEREQFLVNAPFASIIVATRDRPEPLAACLSSLLALHYPQYEIVVVDNAPRTNATADLVQKFAHSAPHIHYVREDHPGLPWAHNRGIMAARGEILAFTDDDVVVDAYWLVGLIRGFSIAENVACVTGLILPMELETPAQFLFEAYGGFTRGFVRRVFDWKEHRPEWHLYPYIAGPLGTGASMAFTAAFLHSEGGFDPALGPGCRTAGGEDLDAFFRVIAHGYQLVYEPESLLYHLHRQDYAHLQKQIYGYGVGFTAYLTKCLLDNPRLVSDFIGKFLCGLFSLLRSRQLKQRRETTPYSTCYLKELTITDWKGRLHGPFAYIRSRWESGSRRGLVISEECRTCYTSEDKEMNENLLLDRRASASKLPNRYHDQLSGYIPVRIVEVELEHPLPTLSAFDEKKGRDYQRARCLVRLHTQPLGLVELTLDTDELSPDAYAPKIWQALHLQINEHLRQDGLQAVTTLTADGLPSLNMPRCVEEREQFLMNAPFASIIVATRDRPESLAVCLNSLLALHYPQYEIIVVDNAPGTNATADLVQKLAHGTPHIHYVREDHPGLASAHNRGIMAARGEILAFTDDDVVVDSYWLVNLVKGFGAAEHVACVTGLILPMELETPAQFLFEAYGGFTIGFVRCVFDWKEHRSKLPLHPYIAGRFGTGASMAFTAAFLHSEGGFDPALGPGCRTAGGEDLDAFFRVIERGYQLVYEPASLLYHLHRRDYVHLQKQIYGYGVGFTAYLTKIMMDHPKFTLDFAGKVPYALVYLLRLRLSKQKEKPTYYPKELTITEWKGMLYGPFAYIRSRWEMRKLSRKLTWDETCVVIPERRDD